MESTPAPHFPAAPAAGGAGRLPWLERPHPLLAPLLAALEGVYRVLVSARLLGYRRGWLHRARVACPVLSVGNLTVGGSGKTPLVEYLLREAVRAGRAPVVLSRGYGGRSRAALMRARVSEGLPADPVALGDEPAMLARRNPGTAVYVGRDRRATARLALLWDRPGLILLDDGFQHLRLRRDLDLVLVDAERGLGNGRLLPRGPLREPLASLRRADAVLITKASLGDAPALRARLEALLGRHPPVFTCDYRAERLRRLDGGAELPPQALAGRTVSALCAIARPGGFARTLAGLGAALGELRAYPDHHPYHDGELARLDVELAEAAAAGADEPGGLHPQWVTTEKDAVKLTGRLRHPQGLWVLEMAVTPEPAAQAFFFDFIESGALQ